MTSPSASPASTTPSLLRRLAAILYDGLLLLAILLLAAFPYLKLLGDTSTAGAARIGFQLYLAVIVAGFFCWFWVHGGQTLGMRAWRLKLVSAHGGSVSWTQAAIRLLAALVSAGALGLGYLWVLIDRDRLAWHDRMSATRLILLPKSTHRSMNAPRQVDRDNRK
jgi:uncharacterized RDD family membrane protein YckC